MGQRVPNKLPFRVKGNKENPGSTGANQPQAGHAGGTWGRVARSRPTPPSKPGRTWSPQNSTGATLDPSVAWFPVDPPHRKL